jgi:branched-chain amino acid transport system permease protein
MKDKRALIQVLSYGAPIVFAFVLPLFIHGAYNIHVLILIAMNIILASSLRIIHLTGQMSVAHGGMMTIGAYTSTLLVLKLGLSTWAAMLLAGCFAAIIAGLLGFPFVKMKGIYFAIATVFLTASITVITEQWRSLTGGSTGLYNIPKPDPIVIPGILKITFVSSVSCYYLILVIMLVSLLILFAIEHSRIGLTFRSIKQSDFLAESVGVNTVGYRVLAFSIGCFFAGLTGGFYSQYMTAINPTTFGFIFSVNCILYLVVGGPRKFVGPLLGAIILTLLPEVARPLKQYTSFLFAGILMLIIFLMPEGIIGLPGRLRVAAGLIFKGKKGHA